MGNMSSSIVTHQKDQKQFCENKLTHCQLIEGSFTISLVKQCLPLRSLHEYLRIEMWSLTLSEHLQTKYRNIIL